MSSTHLLLLFLRCLVPWPFLFLVLLTTALADETPALTVRVEGLRSSVGQVCVSLYGDSETFLKPTGALASDCRSAEKSGVTLTLALPAKAGKLAVGVLHDENGNGKVDTNFIGIPKEGIGVSNNVKPRFGPPRFDDAAFDAGTTRSLNIGMFYF